MKYAFNDGGTLRDVIMADPRLVFVAGYADQFIEVPDDVQTGYVWDGTQFVPPHVEVDINALAAEKLAAINNGKNTALDGGFSHNGVLFDSDLKARAAYQDLDTELRINPTYTTQWKASRGVWVAMDKTLYDALRVSYKEHISACFAWQAEQEQKVAAAVQAGDLEALLAVAQEKHS